MFPISDAYTQDLKCTDNADKDMQVKCITWSHSGNQLLVVNWNRIVAKFQVSNNQLSLRNQIKLTQVPTAGCFSFDDKTIYIGFIDGNIGVFNSGLVISMNFKAHGSAINSLHQIPQTNVLVSTAYQQYVNFWQNGKLIHSVDVNQKVFVTDYNNGIFVGAMANQKIFMFNIKNIAQGKIMYFDSELGKGSQILSLAVSPNGDFLSYGSVDGRNNISEIKDEGEKVQSFMTFKSHKNTQSVRKTILFPVNSVGFNIRSSHWLFSAGSNGEINFWDFNQKNKIKAFIFNGNPVCCASVSPNGQYIAYANGDDWHEGVEGGGKWANRIGIHVIAENELSYKYSA